MLRSCSVFVTIAAIVCSIAVATPAFAQESSPVYRLFNTDTQAHFLTASEGERDAAAAMPQWMLEGEAMRAFTMQVEGTMPVTRFFNTENGTHYYTISDTVVQMLDGMANFTNEGVAFYAWPGPLQADPRDVPVYEFTNADNGAQFLTATEFERDIVDKVLPMYEDDGVAFYVDNPLEGGLTPVGTYASGVEGGSEIVDYDASTERLYVTNGDADAIDVILLSDPTNPVLIDSIDLTPFGSGVNSVAVNNGLIAVAVEQDGFAPSELVLFQDADLDNAVATVPVGVLPDMVAISDDGLTAIVCCEGEPSEDYTTDPEGTIWIVDLSGGAMSATATELTFDAFTEAEIEATGGRIFGPGASVSQDLEPEYAAFGGNGMAYVVMQENNAIALVDLAVPEIVAVRGLGFKDHSLECNALDASNEDGGINIRTWENVYGMYQPDAIAAYTVDGVDYIVTANEGDARDYDGFSEEVRVADLTLDETAFNAEMIQMDSMLGRLKVTNTMGDTDMDGDFDQLFSYGARSMSIWRVEGDSLVQVYDSGYLMERVTANMIPDDFNSTDDENNSFDNRSDDKGPEPEALTLGVADGKTFAFVGLERIGGIMTFDITNPEAPIFIQYINTRNFDAMVGTPEAGDLAPEGLVFIPAMESPTGVDLVVGAFEISGTTSVFEME